MSATDTSARDYYAGIVAAAETRPGGEATGFSAPTSDRGVPTIPSPTASPGRSDLSSDRAERSPDEGQQGTKAAAVALFQSIGREFVRLRATGRSQAWADYEDQLMTHSALFLEHGLISLKDLTGTIIDIEQFRKQEQGTQQAPGDWLSDWLNAKPGDAEAMADVVPQVQKGKAAKPVPRVNKRKGLSVNQKAKMKRNITHATHDPDPPPAPISVQGIPDEPEADE